MPTSLCAGAQLCRRASLSSGIGTCRRPCLARILTIHADAPHYASLPHKPVPEVVRLCSAPAPRKKFGLGALHFDMHTCHLQLSDVSSRTVNHAAKRHTQITEHDQPGKQVQHAGWSGSACVCAPGQGIVAGVIPSPLYQAPAHDLYSTGYTMRVMTSDATLLKLAATITDCCKGQGVRHTWTIRKYASCHTR